MISLVVFVAATVVALAAVIWSGASHRRNLHYGLVVVMLTFLALAIWRAEAYGATLEFTGTAATLKTIHFVWVWLTFLSLPLVVLSGVRLTRATAETDPGLRATHKKAATAFVLFVVLAAGFGTAMTMMATPV